MAGVSAAPCSTINAGARLTPPPSPAATSSSGRRRRCETAAGDVGLGFSRASANRVVHGRVRRPPTSRAFAADLERDLAVKLAAAPSGALERRARRSRPRPWPEPQRARRARPRARCGMAGCRRRSASLRTTGSAAQCAKSSTGPSEEASVSAGSGAHAGFRHGPSAVADRHLRPAAVVGLRLHHDAQGTSPVSSASAAGHGQADWAARGARRAGRPGLAPKSAGMAVLERRRGVSCRRQLEAGKFDHVASLPAKGVQLVSVASTATRPKNSIWGKAKDRARDSECARSCSTARRRSAAWNTVELEFLPTSASALTASRRP